MRPAERGGAAFHPVTHGLLGWTIAHVGRGDRPTRFWCLVASVIPDLDGISIVFGVSAYQQWHHVIAHNLLFCGMVVAVAARWIGLRPVPLFLVAASFVSHLVGDYFGSGPGWAIQPYLPFSDATYLCDYAWELASWQNFVITLIVGAVALRVAVVLGRTPLEFVHSGLERAVVDTLRLRGDPKACTACPSRAGVLCQSCNSPLCAKHVATYKGFSPRCIPCVSPATAPPTPAP